MSAHICDERQVDPGWPHRTSILIARDHRLYPAMVGNLLDAEPSEDSDEPPPLVHDALLHALTIDDIIQSGAAAFVAGRCTTKDDTDDKATEAALDALIAGFDPKRLRSRATVYMEAVMSSALLGHADRARELLTTQVTDPGHTSIGEYLGAFYLAQLGSPAGYPRLHADLHDKDDAHARIMAVRHLLAFVPFDGQTVAKLTIDVTGEFLKRLRDRDSDVGVEVPELMVEARIPGLQDHLRAATARPYSKDVRRAAEGVLDQLGAKRDD